MRIISDIDFNGYIYEATYKKELTLHQQIISRDDINIDLIYSLLVDNVEYVTRFYQYIDKEEIIRDDSSIRQYFYNALEISLHISDYNHYYRYEDLKKDVFIYFYLEQNKDVVYDLEFKSIKPLFSSDITNLDTIVEVALSDYYNLELYKLNGEKQILIGNEAYDYLKSIGAVVNPYQNYIDITINNHDLNINKNLSINMIDDVNGIGDYNVSIHLPNNIKNEDITKDNIVNILIQNNVNVNLEFNTEYNYLRYTYSASEFFKKFTVTSVDVYGDPFVSNLKIYVNAGNLNLTIHGYQK